MYLARPSSTSLSLLVGSPLLSMSKPHFSSVILNPGLSANRTTDCLLGPAGASPGRVANLSEPGDVINGVVSGCLGEIGAARDMSPKTAACLPESALHAR